MEEFDFNPFSGEIQYTTIGATTYGVRAVFNGKESLSDILKRRILREYELENSTKTYFLNDTAVL